MKLPDGLTEVHHAMPPIMEMIAETARWVHPEVFRAFPLWNPETARKAALYKADWVNRQTNNKEPKFEGNVAAQKALFRALGVKGKKPKNWTTCHIWGYDDDRFSSTESVVRDPRYFSCVGNMVLLPTPLKGFTDSVPEIKHHLRVCAFHLFGWVCEHHTVAEEARVIRSGRIPEGYPDSWPTGTRNVLPAGIGSDLSIIAPEIDRQKAKILRHLEDAKLTNYPREQVRSVLEFWKVQLPAR